MCFHIFFSISIPCVISTFLPFYFSFRLPRTSSIKMVDAWLLFTLLIPFAEVLLHTRMEQLKQKLKQLENRVVTMKKSQEITKNQVQPQSVPKSIKTSSMVMPLDGIINACEDEKDQMTKKLRYIHNYFPILSNYEQNSVFFYFSKIVFS